MPALKRYQTFFLMLLAGIVVLGFVFNTTVNPFRVTPMPWSSKKLDRYRDIENDWNRTSKAGLVRSGTWDAAMFGSSRVDIGLDPNHHVFNGLHCVNLGLNAGLLVENHAMFRYYMQKQNPRLVVLAIDAGDLTSPLPDKKKKKVADFALSPLDPKANPLERELRYHAGISTLAASFTTVGRAIRGEVADHTPQGFRRDAEFPENQRKLISSLYLSTTYRLAQARIAHDGLSEGKMEMLREIVAECRKADARLVIFYTPNHVLFQLAFRELGDVDCYFERDRRALADLAAEANAANPSAAPIEVWDFLDGHPLNAPPLPAAGDTTSHLPNWLDLFHATPEIGKEMLDRIDGGGTYGERLTPEGIPARIAKVRADLEAYAARYPEDLDFLRQSLSKFQSPPLEK
ncbi:hypothetical protein OKA04_00460 [Luteolibacter flavescens]|uniref:Uncharacterized protein n=1 Tax=Luteolibacter flavescens TaxID=1859460 RepID=A0ABT3FHY5_9BACT|nr:hypothetical protein [Luteolibacter flavescens]MCW1883179.1 hypothetical protein [Luteolibacter flavescens]